ncbi:hypothetical protein BY996DRAFT_7201416 [Phakopsora pachyrhizi]|nr:hypothetical protein BY996DRAFT_7201416 [Phakopsora pachyrhizi]
MNKFAVIINLLLTLIFNSILNQAPRTRRQKIHQEKGLQNPLIQLAAYNLLPENQMGKSQILKSMMFLTAIRLTQVTLRLRAFIQEI